MKRGLRRLVLVSWALCPPVALGGTSLQSCQVCHGARGEGNAELHAPAVAGQHPGYLQRQIANFRDGRRGADPLDTYGAMMRAQALATDARDLEQATAEFAAMPANPVKSGGGDAARGRTRYETDCAACHGLRGEGYPQLGTPGLRILDANYIAAQIEAFRRGWRGAGVNDGPRDQHGEWMRAVAATVTDARDPADIQAYLATLP
jgi:cytochrome c553